MISVKKYLKSNFCSLPRLPFLFSSQPPHSPPWEKSRASPFPASAPAISSVLEKAPPPTAIRTRCSPFQSRASAPWRISPLRSGDGKSTWDTTPENNIPGIHVQDGAGKLLTDSSRGLPITPFLLGASFVLTVHDDGPSPGEENSPSPPFLSTDPKIRRQ